MDLITVTEAATRLGVRREAIYYSLSHGKLTRHRQYGKILVDVSELKDYTPRAHPSRIPKPAQNRSLVGRGFLAGSTLTVDDFITRRSAEATLDH